MFTCHSGCIWKVLLLCVFWSASSVRRSERSATRSHPMNTCTASHLKRPNTQTHHYNHYSVLTVLIPMLYIMQIFDVLFSLSAYAKRKTDLASSIKQTFYIQPKSKKDTNMLKQCCESLFLDYDTPQRWAFQECRESTNHTYALFKHSPAERGHSRLCMEIFKQWAWCNSRSMCEWMHTARFVCTCVRECNETEKRKCFTSASALTSVKVI